MATRVGNDLANLVKLFNALEIADGFVYVDASGIRHYAGEAICIETNGVSFRYNVQQGEFLFAQTTECGFIPFERFQFQWSEDSDRWILEISEAK